MSAKHPMEATFGDYIRLTQRWQDASGIPLFVFSPGDVFKVLCPDLTTGGVVVIWGGEIPITFSLSPEQYVVIDSLHAAEGKDD